MRSPGINGEGELRGQPANTGSPGKMAVKTECVCVVTSFNVVHSALRRYDSSGVLSRMKWNFTGAILTPSIGPGLMWVLECWMLVIIEPRLLHRNLRERVVKVHGRCMVMLQTFIPKRSDVIMTYLRNRLHNKTVLPKSK